MNKSGLNHSQHQAATNLVHTNKTPSPNDRPERRLSQADKRINFLLKQHFQNDPAARPNLETLAQLDPTPKKTYLPWIVKHWLAGWNNNPEESKRLTESLTTHFKGAKYFSPLTWTGLRLEDVGYHADIYRYTPQTLAKMPHQIAEIIRIDEEDKQIRKGNLVALAGAEVAYKDEKYTLIRIRTIGALRRLSQGSSWCVEDSINIRGFSVREDEYPFDFILSHEGERYLANGDELRNRWNESPAWLIEAEINRIRLLAGDGRDRLNAAMNDYAKSGQRLDQETERKLFDYPDLAIHYAARAIQSPWEEFESHVKVADLSASQAVEYAIKVRRSRWIRFENKIRRSRWPLYLYRSAFPGAIPYTEQEINQQKIEQWRKKTPSANRTAGPGSVQSQAESERRDPVFEERLLKEGSKSVERYARLVASLAVSELADRYRETLLSYFKPTKDKLLREVNLAMARLICRQFRRQIEYLEPRIAKDAECSFNYAMGNRKRFIQGEEVILSDPEFSAPYCKQVLREFKTEETAIRHVPRYLPLSRYREAWSFLD